MTQKLKKQENSDEDDEKESEEKTNLEPEYFKDKQNLFYSESCMCFVTKFLQIS